MTLRRAVAVAAALLASAAAWAPLASPPQRLRTRACAETKPQPREARSLDDYEKALAGEDARDNEGLFPKQEQAGVLTAEPGLKVGPMAWKWPGAFPYGSDTFDTAGNGTEAADAFAQPSFEPAFSAEAAAELRAHIARLNIPTGATVLEMGAGAHSYYPPMSLYEVTGLGLSAEEMAANTDLKTRTVLDFNAPGFTLPYADNSFDSFVFFNSAEFVRFPRELFRELFRVLKPRGNGVIAFTALSNNKQFEAAHTKLWADFNDAQRMWVAGSFFYFGAGQGFTSLKGYDFSPQEAKGPEAPEWAKGITDRFKGDDAGNGAAKSLPDPKKLYVVQAKKAPMPTREAGLRHMQAMLWAKPGLEGEDVKLCTQRLYSIAEAAAEAGDDAAVERAYAAVDDLVKIYGLCEPMLKVLPVPLIAQMAANVAATWSSTPEELDALSMGLGMSTPSEAFWKPLSDATKKLTADEKIWLLVDLVPLFAPSAGNGGKPQFADGLEALPAAVVAATAVVAEKCPAMPEADTQLVAAELCTRDFLKEDEASRASFPAWVESLTASEVRGILRDRKDYKATSSYEAEFAKYGTAEALLVRMTDKGWKPLTPGDKGLAGMGGFFGNMGKKDDE